MTKVDVFVSDPWEFGTECGSGPFTGRVVEIDDDAYLIRLDTSLNYRGLSFKSLIAKPRHVGVTPTDFDLAEGMLSTNMVLSISSPDSLQATKSAGVGENLVVIGSLRATATT